MPSVDDEIKQLKGELGTREDTHPDYLPPETKELQNLVLASHARLESVIEHLIVYHATETIASKVDIHELRKLRWRLHPIVDRHDYMIKLDMVKSFYDDFPETLYKHLKKVNKYRILFAHPEGVELRNEYRLSEPDGKEKVRDMLRCLTMAENEMDQFFLQLTDQEKGITNQEVAE